MVNLKININISYSYYINMDGARYSSRAMLKLDGLDRSMYLTYGMAPC